MGRKYFRKNVRQGAAVLKNVRHPAGTPQVVLENPKFTLFITDEVDTGNVNSHKVRRNQSECRSMVMPGTRDQVPRNHAVVEDFPQPIHICQEHLQGTNPLADSRLHPIPFGSCHDTGDQVQREWSLAT